MLFLGLLGGCVFYVLDSIVWGIILNDIEILNQSSVLWISPAWLPYCIIISLVAGYCPVRAAASRPSSA